MGHYELLAEIFYKGEEKYSKAIAAGKAMDNKLRSDYSKITSSIYFDASNYIAYFDYDKLVKLPDYETKLKDFYKQHLQNENNIN